MNRVTPEQIIAIAKEHYSKNDKPLWLSDVGVALRTDDSRPDFGDYKTLQGVIKGAGEGNLQIVRHPEIAARIAVVTPEKRSVVEAQVVGSPLVATETSYIDQLPRAMLIAFCHRNVEDDIYLRSEPPIRYHKGAVAGDDQSKYILIEPKFRRPGLDIARISDGEKVDLGKSISAWAETHKIPLSIFVDHRAGPHFVGANALDRFISAQDQAIINRILIPADIARILSQHH